MNCEIEAGSCVCGELAKLGRTQVDLTIKGDLKMKDDLKMKEDLQIELVDRAFASSSKVV